MKNCFKILVTSQKGGVGKSTLSANLAAYLQCAGYSVTLIDFDTHGSSSSWLLSSPNVGVAVQHRILPLNQGSNRPFMDARLHLRRAANVSEVVICDLTWTDCISSDLMFEYDLVIVPTSVSDIEVAATAEFLHRNSWVFDSPNRTSPILLLTPMRVQLSQLSGDVFSTRRFPFSFMLAPPVLESQTARDMFQCGYIKDLKDACGESFNEFCNAVCAIRNMQHASNDSIELAFKAVGFKSIPNSEGLKHHKWRNNLSMVRHKLNSQYSLLERHHLEKMKTENVNFADSLSNLSAPSQTNSLFSLKLPKFLKSR
jgi:cellulose biosynthesis protein BcsQ